MKSSLKQSLVVLSAVFPAVLCSAAAPQQPSVSPESGTVEQWDLYEITLTAAQVPAHPFCDVQVSAEFVHLDSGEKPLVPGFFDGDGAGGQTGRIWKIRFMPARPGRWTWRTAATIPETGLNNHTGELFAAPPRAGNHGPLVRSGPPYLHPSCADGHHPFLIGTWSVPMHSPPRERQRFYEYFQQTGMNRLRMWLGGRKSDGLEDPKARLFGGDGIEKKLSWRARTKTGVRKVHWVITASGSFGTTCLVGCGEFMSGWDVDQLQRRGTLAQLGILARTLRSLPFWEMAPANELVSPLAAVIAPTRSPDTQRPSGPGAGDGQPWRSTFAIAKPGEAYLVYSLKGGDGTVQLAPGTYEVTQLNPRDGSTRALGEVTGGMVPFTLPGSAPKDHNLQDETDWILIYRGHTK